MTTRRFRLRQLLVLVIACSALCMAAGCRSGTTIRVSESALADAAAQAGTPALPAPGTILVSLAPGEGMDAVRTRCLVCHSPAMLLQQKLTAQQWTAEVEKMRGWGALVPNEDAPRIVRYLVTVAGPDNTRFTPDDVMPLRPGTGQ